MIYKSVHDTIFKDKNLLIDSAALILSVFFLALTANITIPLWPVPITMQTFGVFLIAFYFGAKKGFLSILAYIIAGVSGLAVFSGWKSGITAFVGPTAGYLIGFLFMVIFIGMMIEKGFGRTKKSVLCCILIGEMILYSFGLTGLAIYLGETNIFRLLQLGLIPFIIGDIIKAIVAVQLFPLFWKNSTYNH